MHLKKSSPKLRPFCLSLLETSTAHDMNYTICRVFAWSDTGQFNPYPSGLLRRHWAIIRRYFYVKKGGVGPRLSWSDDVIKWKHFSRYWPFVRGIHRSPVNSTHKGQWRGALIFSLICAWINGWVNNREAGDLRRHRAHYDVIIMICSVVSDRYTIIYSALWNLFQIGYHWLR